MKLKTYGIDFEGGGETQDLKLESGPVFPSGPDIGPGNVFWLTSGSMPGPYVNTGQNWLKLQISELDLNLEIASIKQSELEHLNEVDPHPQYIPEDAADLRYSLTSHTHAGVCELIGTTEPAALIPNHLTLYAQSQGGRLIPHWVENNSSSTAVQPALFGNNIILWLPGTSSTAAINFGASFVALNNGAGASQTTPTLSSANAVTQMKRAAFNTGSSTTGNSGIITTASVAWRGNSAKLGGFFFFARFALESYSVTERFFVGLSANNAAMNGVNPSTWNNTIGIGKDNSDGVLYVISRDTTTVTKLSTGITPNPSQILDLQLFCKPNDNKITVRIVDPVAGIILVDNLIITTNLPLNTAFLYMQAQIESVTGTVPKMLSLNRMYLESDT